MRLRTSLLATTVALVAAMTVAVAAPTAGAGTSQAAGANAVSQQLVGTAGSQVYDLTATVDQVVAGPGGLEAVGTIAGTVTDRVTGAVSTVNEGLSSPVGSVAQLAGGTVVLSLGAVEVTALGTTLSLQPIQATVGSGILSGVAAQLSGLLGGIGVGGTAGAPPPSTGGQQTRAVDLLNGLLGVF